MIIERYHLQTEVTGTEDGKHTYEIYREWNPDGKKAVIIELYPTISVLNAGALDLSTMHLLNHVSDFGWGSVTILNLYSTVFNKKPSATLLTEDVENLAYIEEVLEREGIGEYDIILAWGTTLSKHAVTREAKRQILSMIQDKGLTGQTKQIFTEYLDTTTQCGVHPLYLGLHFGKELWKLGAYPVAEELEYFSQVSAPEKGKKKKNRKRTRKTEEDRENVSENQKPA